MAATVGWPHVCGASTRPSRSSCIAALWRQAAWLRSTGTASWCISTSARTTRFSARPPSIVIAPPSLGWAAGRSHLNTLRPPSEGVNCHRITLRGNRRLRVLPCGGCPCLQRQPVSNAVQPAPDALALPERSPLADQEEEGCLEDILSQV